MAANEDLNQEYAVPTEFNNTSGDIVLRSLELLDFRVHRINLSEASPVFEHIFSNPPTILNGDQLKDGVLVVRME